MNLLSKENAKEFVAELENIDMNLLSKEDNMNCKLLHLELSTYVSGMGFKCHLFPVNCLEGPHIDFKKTISWMKTENLKDIEKILSRFNKFPVKIDQTIELLQKGIETGYVNAKVSMENVPNQFAKLVETPAEESAFYEPFKKLPSSIDEKERISLQEKALTAITKKLYPAFTKIMNFIKDSYLSACRDDIACTSLPSGKLFYEEVLKFHLSTDMSSDEVHQIGLDEVARIHTKMSHVMKETGYTGSFPEFLKYLKNEKKFYMDNKDEFMMLYQKTCKEIDKLMPKYFNTLPKINYEIKEMPFEVAISGPGAFFNAGSIEGRPGTFFINTHQLEKKPTYSCPALSLHEAIPGHHHQLSIAMEATKLPAFRRYVEDKNYYSAPGRFALHVSFVEGWGLYSEYLGEEMKMYKTPYELFGRLSFEMFRACRCVVDTGMHMKGWSRQQAVDYMIQNTGLPHHEIENEINRYITWPGQACGYKIGEIKIRELRKKAENELGENFNLKEFHDCLLLEGGIPLSVLEQLVDDFIERKK
ncbi:uncharacterized protein LOC124439105 isoform X2 [Xenia sp. Carnegie-2017]|uniref:uncharacterized protein LOC124439105 isoform X2 n=1 Tax=Xenia sp. Carnegie-2017 TaxID=2897299 RepID=UPI001F03EA97|nr:uncharacterized protein LOC124439105 isoform X2 [Xenia sp. Carnegie-2017]